MQPNHIGQYRILKLLGKGGMGMVWLGEHDLLGRRAAIKTLRPDLSSQQDIVDRFFNEARATAAIADPGVVQIHDFGYHVDGTAYIVMEHLEGEALCDRMDRLGPLPLVHALGIVRQIASALAAAHAVGVVHRDVKPENIFLVPEADLPHGERAKLLDFGICKFQAPINPHTTEAGLMLGTPVYMAPEQCRGQVDLDGRADLYALGCVMFHMLTAHLPFEASDPADLLAAHLHDPAPTPSTLLAGLPPEVDALVLRCLVKEPADRFQTMGDLQAAIDQVLVGLDGHVDLPQAPRAMKLASGYHSAYDANRDANPPSEEQEARPPRHDQAVTPCERPLVITRTPITVPTNTSGWRVVGRGVTGIAILGLVLGFGLVAHAFTSQGGVATTVRAIRREPIATPSPTPTADIAATVVTIARAPAAPALDLDAALAMMRASLGVMMSPVIGARAPARGPVVRETAGRVVRVVRTVPPPPAAPNVQSPTKNPFEDLYDTR